MAEQKSNSDHPNNIELGPLPLCPNCLRPCNPREYYCQNCDSNEVINPLASYMPFVRIRFNCGLAGKTWSNIWYNSDRPVPFRLFCILILIIYAPILLLVGIPMLLLGRLPCPRHSKTMLIIAVVVVLILVAAVALLKSAPYFQILNRIMCP